MFSVLSKLIYPYLHWFNDINQSSINYCSFCFFFFSHRALDNKHFNVIFLKNISTSTLLVKKLILYYIHVYRWRGVPGWGVKRVQSPRQTCFLLQIWMLWHHGTGNLTELLWLLRPNPGCLTCSFDPLFFIYKILTLLI